MALATYTSAQRGAHWLVLGLVVFQFLTSGGMVAGFEAAVDGGTFNGTAWVHGFLGTVILITMLFRLGLRMTRGAPPPPETEPEKLQWVSRGNHYLFYAVLIAMPLAGMLATYTLSETIATLHALTSKLLIVLIVAHVAGAAWHIYKRDGVIERMAG